MFINIAVPKKIIIIPLVIVVIACAYYIPIWYSEFSLNNAFQDMKSSNKKCNKRAIDTFREKKDDSVSFLLDKLKSPNLDFDDKMAAVKALGHLNVKDKSVHEDSVSFLLNGIKSPNLDFEDKAAALKELGNLNVKNESIIRNLESIFKESDNRQLRKALVDFLMKLNPNFVDRKLQALYSSDPLKRKLAEEFICMSGNIPLEKLLEKSSKRMLPKESLNKLFSTAGKNAIPLLTRQLMVSNKQVASFASDMLVKIHPQGIRQLILAYTSGKNIYPNEILQSLASLEFKTFYQILNTLPLKDQSTFICSLNNKRFIPLLKKIYETNNPEQQKQVIYALSGVENGDTPFIDFIENTLKKKNQQFIAQKIIPAMCNDILLDQQRDKALASLKKLAPISLRAVPTLIKDLRYYHVGRETSINFSRQVVYTGINESKDDTEDVLTSMGSMAVCGIIDSLKANKKLYKTAIDLQRKTNFDYIKPIDKHLAFVKTTKSGENTYIKLEGKLYTPKIFTKQLSHLVSILAASGPRSQKAGPVLKYFLDPSENLKGKSIKQTIKHYKRHKPSGMELNMPNLAIKIHKTLYEIDSPAHNSMSYLIYMATQNNASAIRALGHLGRQAKPARPYLKRLVKKSNILSSKEAFEALKKIYPEYKTDESIYNAFHSNITGCLEKQHYITNHQANKALGKQAELLIPMLLNAIASNNKYHRKNALSTLWSICYCKECKEIFKNKSTRDNVISTLKQVIHSSEDYATRKSAISILANMGTYALPTLVELLKSDKYKINRMAIAIDIINIQPDNEDAVSYIIKRFSANKNLRRRTVIILKTIGPPAEFAVPMLQTMLKRKLKFAKVSANDANDVLRLCSALRSILSSPGKP